jgi:hypothetical protein
LKIIKIKIMKPGKLSELPDLSICNPQHANFLATSHSPFIANDSKTKLATYSQEYRRADLRSKSITRIKSPIKPEANYNKEKVGAASKPNNPKLPSIQPRSRFSAIKPAKRKRLQNLYCISITQPSIPKPPEPPKICKKPSINVMNLLVPVNNAAEDNSTDLCENDPDSIEELESPLSPPDVSLLASAKFNSPALFSQPDESQDELINTEYSYMLQSSKLTSKSITHMTVKELESELQITSNVIRYHEVKVHLLTSDPIFQGIQGKLRKWRAGELLGQGSMGQVIKAFDVNTGNIIAVKRLFFNPNNPKQKDLIESLKQEANILKHFRNPNIVSYIGSEIIDENLYVYLEYVPGGSLAHLLGNIGPLPEKTIKVYMKQILKGVEYLHKNRVVHRDIKAANLLVDIDGTIKLSDFGCARRYESDMQSGLLNSVRGSLLWMAPEVIKQSGYGRRADIWSLGCTLIELFTGKPPWNNFDNSISAMLRIGLSSDLPEVPEAISPEARDFIYACLQRDAHLRPTASHLLHHPFVN